MFQALLDDLLTPASELIDGEKYYIVWSPFMYFPRLLAYSRHYYFSLAPLTEVYDYSNDTEELSLSSAEINETIDWMFSFFDEPGKDTHK